MATTFPVSISPISSDQYRVSCQFSNVDQVLQWHHLKSASFQVPSSSSTWHLAFYPLGRSEVVGMASFLLNHEGPTREKINFSLIIKSQLPSGQDKQHRMLNYDFSNDGFGFLDMISIPNLKDPTMGYLINNTVHTDCIINLTRSSEALPLDLKRLLFASDFSDAVIRCGSETFPVHRLVLSLRSPVFSAMFQSAMVESTKGELIIDDFDVNGVREFLTCVYSTECDLNGYNQDMLMELCKLSSKYAVKNLQQLLEDQLSRLISLDNCIDLLVYADAHQCSRLKAQVFAYFQGNLRAVLSQHKAAMKDLLGELSLEFMTYLADNATV